MQASPLGAHARRRRRASEPTAPGGSRSSPTARCPGHPEVFVVGDLMSLDGLPGLAEVAIQSGRHAADEIRRRLDGDAEPRPFRYRDLGSLAAVSRYYAVGERRPLRVSGFAGWLLWLVVHLALLTGFKNRVSALAHWTIASSAAPAPSARSPRSRSSRAARSPHPAEEVTSMTETARDAAAPDLRRAAARAVHRVARPDDRVDRAADDRRRPRRPPAPLLGGDRVPAGVDGGRPAVREARRSLRPQARPPGRARALPRRLGAVRAGAEHAAADRVQSNPGARRRRPDRRRDGRRRRPRRAARPRPLPGPVRRRVRRLGRRRAAARRLLRRQPLVAVDLLHQPAARSRRAGGDRDRLPLAAGDDAAPDRLARHDRPRRRAVGRHPLHEPRRHELRLGRAGDARGDQSAASRCSRCSRSSRRAPKSRSCRRSSSAT